MMSALFCTTFTRLSTYIKPFDATVVWNVLLKVTEIEINKLLKKSMNESINRSTNQSINQIPKQSLVEVIMIHREALSCQDTS